MTKKQSRLGRLILALARNQSGSTVVELAFIAPAMLMFILGIMEVGRVLWLQNALDYSVVEAARCLSNSPTTCASASQAQSFAASQSGAGFDSSVFTVTSASCGNKVTASYPVMLDIPYVNLSTTLTSQACYPT
jgi:Flp pilus assembly protein TadG